MSAGSKRPKAADEAQVIALVDAVEAKLQRQLAEALREIAELKAREAVREERRSASMAAVARNARISRAAIAADMTVDDWLAHCRKLSRDPTKFPEATLSRPRWTPKAKRGAHRR